jgi:hypothetical protein
MQAARRLYVYLMAGVSLGVLVSGLSLLLAVALESLGLSAGDPLFGGEAASRERLTVASAMTVVSLPVWLIHWFLAERSVRPERPTAAEERSSDVRGLYFALALGALLAAAAVSAGSLIEAAVTALAGESVGFRSPAGDLALLVVAGSAWAYQVWIRVRDSAWPMTGPGVFLPRTYLYGAVLVGLLMLLFGIRGLIETVGRMVLDAPIETGPVGVGAWWVYPLATATAQVVVGGVLWAAHWWYAGSLFAASGWRGASERAARLRLAFYVVVLVIGTSVVVALVGEGARHTIEWALGISEIPGQQRQVGAILLPLLSAIPFAIAWWSHARSLRLEAMSVDDDERIESAARLEGYSVALVGLAYGAVALSWLLRVLIDALAGGERTLAGAELWQRELAQIVPLVVLGAALWLWKWSAVQSRRAASPMTEAASTVRRATLLIVLAVSVLSVIGSLGLILNPAFGALFGVSLPGDPISELSGPIGILVVATAVAIYHGMALLRDQALRGRAKPAEEEPRRELFLRLSGPPHADLASTLGALRAHMPEGYLLEEATPADPA